MLNIIVDTLGSDLGSAPVKEAIKNFLKLNDDVKITAVGNQDELKELEGLCEIVHAPDIVPMEAGPLEVMRMKNSSMFVANRLMKERQADAVVSAGSTGGFLSCATLLLKTAPNVKRAALVAPFPTKIKGKKVVILDIGASNENSAEELVQFAKMGTLYSKIIYNVKEPKVYLLSNGTEAGKGSPSGKEAYKLLDGKEGFNGNIEARNALSGEADVIVCDGFTGNVFLKSSEGMAKMMAGMMKAAFKKNLWTMLGYLHVKKGINEMVETMDYKSTGGAMLLGINGVVVKAHGSSDAFAFQCALNVAKNLAANKINEKISEELANE
ncbi:MAG: phosphate acyltransferase PlsX [Bacilli bacterium]|nr:phosphate acyltransferase PlsX [Bacilli bacterium]